MSKSENESTPISTVLSFTDDELENMAADGHIKEMKEALPTLITDHYTFGEFIYQYIIDNILTEKEKTNISTDDDYDYYEIIKKQFTKKGLQGKGTLDADGTTKLSKMKEQLAAPASTVSRKVAYLFAFGLGMKEEDLAFLMKAGLQQSAVNVRDPEEVIYYWCLINGKKPEKIYELKAFYDSIPEDGTATPYRINKTYTYDLIQDIKEKISTEDHLRKYLTELKQTVSKKKSLTMKEEYKNNLSACVREEVFDPNLPKIGYEVHEADALYSQSLSTSRIEQELISQSKKAYEIYKGTDYLLDKDVAIRLFEGIAWQANTFANRFSRDNFITRKDLLFSWFLVQTPETSDENLPEDYKVSRYIDFLNDANDQLDYCNLTPLYFRNPFDLFLVICLYMDKPYEYFLANWHLYIQEESKKQFPETLLTCLSKFPDSDRSDFSEAGLAAAQKHLKNPKKHKSFQTGFKKLCSYWTVLSPDPYLQKYESDYEWLLAVYKHSLRQKH